MSNIHVAPLANIWKSVGLSLVIGSALTFTACAAPMAAAPRAQPTLKATETIVASKATAETKPVGQTPAITETKTTGQAPAITETTKTTETTSATTSKPMVMLHENSTLGKILVDEKGMTLYVFDKDSMDKSTCTGDCATKWPAFTAAEENALINMGEGVTAKMGVIKRDDGKYQITANGMPLYYYAQDTAAGDTKGQGVGDVWWVVGADGSKITKK